MSVAASSGTVERHRMLQCKTKVLRLYGEHYCARRFGALCDLGVVTRSKSDQAVFQYQSLYVLWS